LLLMLARPLVGAYKITRWTTQEDTADGT